MKGRHHTEYHIKKTIDFLSVTHFYGGIPALIILSRFRISKRYMTYTPGIELDIHCNESCYSEQNDVLSSGRCPARMMIMISSNRALQLASQSKAGVVVVFVITIVITALDHLWLCFADNRTTAFCCTVSIWLPHCYISFVTWINYSSCLDAEQRYFIDQIFSLSYKEEVWGFRIGNEWQLFEPKYVRLFDNRQSLSFWQFSK